MRTVILGAGTTGLQLAKWLASEGKDVALIERDPDIARVAANALDCLVVEGDGSQPEALERAGIAKAQAFVALTGSDELNIVTCSVAAAEQPGLRRIARVRNSYFTSLAPSRRSFMGVDRFINPDIETARAFVSLLSQGLDSSIVRFSDEDLVLRSSRLAQGSPFAGRSLRESRAALGLSFLAAALERGRGIEIPSGDTVPDPGDVIYLLGAPRDLDELLGEEPSALPRMGKVVLAGGGPVVRLLAEGLAGGAAAATLGLAREAKGLFGSTRRPSVAVVESSMAACKQLARDLPGALVLNRELSDEDLFLEEGLTGADLFVAATEDQELNLLSASRAKLFGVERSLALSENNAYSPLVERLGIDGVISVKSNVVASIVEYLRGGNLTTLHSFYDRGLKILEFTVTEHSRLDEVPIRELDLPKGALVIFINRRGRSSLATGDTRLVVGDRLGIFTSMDAIRKVEELFLGRDA